jgi:outer membrane biosynthesis protein TonB
MSRLYKKSFVASGGLHVLLALILIICPAFLASNPKPSEAQPIDFIPDILIDSPFAGGGDPNAGRPPARAQTPPAPAPLPAPVPQPPQPKPEVKEVAPPKTAEESLEVAKDTKPTKRKPEVTTTAVVIKPKTKLPSADTAAEERQAREQQAMRNRLASAFDRAAGNIKSGSSSATKIEGSYGPGGGGPTYAGYASWVLTVFDNAWVAPEDATSEDATTEVKVTIASDGAVVAKRITKRSGDAAVDASVQRALDRVTNIGRPFPESMKDKERTYIIPFNMKTKRGSA